MLRFPVMSTLLLLVALETSAKPTVLLETSGQAKVGNTIPRLVGYPIGTKQPFTSDTYFRKKDTNTKGVAYVVFATWCEPCIKGIDELLEASSETEERRDRSRTLEFARGIRPSQPMDAC